MSGVVRLLLLIVGLATLPACTAAQVHQEPMSVQAPVLQRPASPTTGDNIATTRTVTVYFDHDSADIRAAAMQILYGAVVDLHGARVNAIRVMGHADSSGRNLHNQKLSQRRAEAVARQLTKLGVQAQSVRVTGAGKAKGAQRHSQRDRRVEVTFELVQAAAWLAPAMEAPPSATPHASSAPPMMDGDTAALSTQQLCLIAGPSDISPAPLRSACKQAIKHILSLDGSARHPPPAAT